MATQKRKTNAYHWAQCFVHKRQEGNLPGSTRPDF
jgi:hypothetical protein